MTFYTAYYEDQVGGRIGRIYVGAPTQRGHGIGSFLGGLYRAVLPLFKSGIKAIGKETLRSGFNILDDVTNKRMDFRDALKNRGKESADNLKCKAMEEIDEIMSGSGYKRRWLVRKAHSIKKHSRRRTPTKRLKKKSFKSRKLNKRRRGVKNRS